MGTDCVKVDVYSDPSVFELIHSEWMSLLAKSTSRSFFLTPQWQKVWWDHFSENRHIWVFVVRSDNNEIVGLCTLTEIDGYAEFLGGRDLCDHLDILSLEGYEEIVANCILLESQERVSELRELNLHFVPDDSRMLQPLKNASEKLGWEFKKEVEETSPYISLPEDWDKYLESLRGKDRHELRRKIRRTAAYASPKIRISTSETLEEDIETFLKLHAMSNPDKSDFMDDSMKDFFRHIGKTTMAEGWLKLSFMEFDAVPASGLWNFDYDGALLIYNSGYDISLSSASPGIAHFAYTIQQAIEGKQHTVDFLRGNENYKYRLGGHDQPLHHLKLCPKV